MTFRRRQYEANHSVGNCGSTQEISSTGSVIASYPFSTIARAENLLIDSSGNVWFSLFNSNALAELPGVAAGPTFFPYTGPQFAYGSR